jgi:hypothetical protein
MDWKIYHADLKIVMCLFVYLQSLIIWLISSTYSESKHIQKFGFVYGQRKCLSLVAVAYKVLSVYDNLKF